MRLLTTCGHPRIRIIPDALSLWLNNLNILMEVVKKSIALFKKEGVIPPISAESCFLLQMPMVPRLIF
jgi:hypothetical protein